MQLHASRGTIAASCHPRPSLELQHVTHFNRLRAAPSKVVLKSNLQVSIGATFREADLTQLLKTQFMGESCRLSGSRSSRGRVLRPFDIRKGPSQRAQSHHLTEPTASKNLSSAACASRLSLDESCPCPCVHVGTPGSAR